MTAPTPPPGGPEIFAFNITEGFATALAEFQAELPKVERNKHVEIETRDQTKDDYDYWYATLDHVSNEAMPLLGKHGLSFTSYPGTGSAGKLSLRYFLMHKSGGFIGAEWPIMGSDAKGIRAMQNLGGMITFIRRYAFEAATGIAPVGEDDNLQHAAATEEETPATVRRQRSQVARTEQAAANTARRTTRQAVTGQPADEPAAEQEPEEMIPPKNPDVSLKEYPQMQKKLLVQFGEMEIKDRDKRLMALGQLLGREIGTQNELTAGEGFELIGIIEPILDTADSPAEARRALQAKARERAAERAQNEPAAEPEETP